MACKWSTNFIVRFLQIYEKYPCLWDASHPSYKNRQERLSAEQCIQNELNLHCDIKAFKTKIKNIRNTYNDEVYKMKSAFKCKQEYLPKLLWFPIADRFLKRSSETGISVEGIEKLEAIRLETLAHLEDSDIEEPYESLQENVYMPVSDSLSIKNPEKSQTKPIEDLKEKNPKKRKLEEDSRVSEMMRSPDSSQNREENEFDIFGNYVAVQLHRLPIKNALELEAQIHQLITETRLNIVRSSGRNSSFIGNSFDEFFANCRDNLTKLRKLHLEQNEISEFRDSNVFCDLPNLLDLHLGDNSLTALHFNLSCLHNLRFLDLQRNKFTKVLERDLRTLDTFAKHNQSVTVDLTLNPFECSCKLNPFIKWMNKTKVTVRNKEHLTCTEGHKEITFHEMRANCSPPLRSGTTILLSLLSLLLVSLICGFIYIQRAELKKKLVPVLDSVNKRVRYTSIATGESREIDV